MKKALNITVTIALFMLFIYLGYAAFSSSYLRLKEALTDLYGSFMYYLSGMTGGEIQGLPPVVRYSEVIRREFFLPEDFSAFTAKAEKFFKTLLSRDNFTAWLSVVGTKTGYAANALFTLLPFVFVLRVIIKKIYARENVKHNKDTLPLKVFKRIAGKTYMPLKRAIVDYICFLKRYTWIWKFWIVIWIFHFNLAGIAAEIVSYFLYFVISYDVKGLYVQAVKLITDLQVFCKFFPWQSLSLIAYFIFNGIRKKTALKRLKRFEARNCGFINELPIVSMTVGSMGKKKTTMITDMALSQEVMFRQKALDIIQRADMKFPYFPWIKLEDELLACMEYNAVYNLATVKEWIKKKRERYEKNKNADLQLYGYDIKRYGFEYNDGLKRSDIFDVSETYALAYFIYAIETSLIVSNYSIRTDNEKYGIGNFPVWDSDFFSDKRISRHSHILDFDVLRLGKKVLENNIRSGSFEFGVVAITEIGKERGNNLELKDIKKTAEETNQKNDLFNSWLKMCRHSATVDNFPFIKIFTDEQRPESWGADARELCDIINIVKSGEQRLALPFYTIEETIAEFAYNKFVSLYYDFRYRRGDNTLLVHILKSVTAWLWKRNLKIYNAYGYTVLRLDKKRGTMDGKTEKKKYYLCNGKIYSDRFTTDCFSDYFSERAKESKTGLEDYPEYLTGRASVEELKLQNSYFIRSLYKSDGE